MKPFKTFAACLIPAFAIPAFGANDFDGAQQIVRNIRGKVGVLDMMKSLRLTTGEGWAGAKASIVDQSSSLGTATMTTKPMGWISVGAFVFHWSESRPRHGKASIDPENPQVTCLEIERDDGRVFRYMWNQKTNSYSKEEILRPKPQG